jgi:hypothetical protein
MPGRLCFGPCALKENYKVRSAPPPLVPWLQEKKSQVGGGGGGARKRDREMLAVLGSTHNRGGMVPGTTTNCVAAVHGALPRLSRERSLLHTMYVEWKTLISQNMFDIVKSCDEMNISFFIEQDVLPTVEGI